MAGVLLFPTPGWWETLWWAEPTSSHQRAFKLSASTGKSQMGKWWWFWWNEVWFLLDCSHQHLRPHSAQLLIAFSGPRVLGIYSFRTSPCFNTANICCLCLMWTSLSKDQNSLGVWGEGHRPWKRSLFGYFPSGNGEDKIYLKIVSNKQTNRQTSQQNSLSLGLFMVCY